MQVFSEPFDFPDDLLDMDRKEAVKIILDKTRQVMEDHLIIMDNFKQVSNVYMAERLTRTEDPTPLGIFKRCKVIEGKMKELKEKDSKRFVELMDDMNDFKKHSNKLGVSKYKHRGSAKVTDLISGLLVLLVLGPLVSFYLVPFRLLVHQAKD